MYAKFYILWSKWEENAREKKRWKNLERKYCILLLVLFSSLTISIEFKSLFNFISNSIEYMNLYVYSSVLFFFCLRRHVEYFAKAQKQFGIWFSVPCGPSLTNTRFVHLFIVPYLFTSLLVSIFLFAIFVCILAFKYIYRP